MTATASGPAAAICRARAVELVRRLGDVCVVDVETTALSPSSGRVVEVAVAVFRGADMVASFSSLVRGTVEPPSMLRNAVPTEALPDAPAFGEVAPILAAFLARADVVVGQNIAFDLAFLKAEFARAGVEASIPDTVLDTIGLAKSSMRLAHHDLASLADATGVAVQRPQHRALADVMTEFEVFMALVTELVRCGKVGCADDLVAFSGRGVRRMKEGGATTPDVPEEVADLVDGLGRLAEERERLTGEIGIAERGIAEACEQLGRKAVAGKEFFVSSYEYDTWEHPNDDAVRERVKEVLSKVGLWDAVAEVNGYLLARLIADSGVAEPALAELEALGRLRRVTRVRVHPTR